MSHQDANDSAVDLRGVSKSFGARKILSQVDLKIADGEFFALLGASGSGKSTLLKLVSGIEVPDEGTVWLRGRDITKLPPHRRPVHTVFQNYALFPHLDVAANVAFPLRVAGVPRSECQTRVRAALGWVHLEDFAARRIDALSGGERQRVALARALVDEPQCVLLDEPLSALDPHLRGKTLQFLQAVQSRLKVTYLYVTHDREEALGAAHRIGVLRLGQLEQVGTPEEIYHQPRTPYVASFIGPISWLQGERLIQDGNSVIRLPTGELVPVALESPLTGTLKVGVRPEAVRLDPAGFLSGKVVHRRFAGATVSLGLRLTDGSEILAEVRAEGVAPTVGEQVRFGWDPAAAHLFPAEATS